MTRKIKDVKSYDEKNERMWSHKTRKMKECLVIWREKWKNVKSFDERLTALRKHYLSSVAVLSVWECLLKKCVFIWSRVGFKIFRKKFLTIWMLTRTEFRILVYNFKRRKKSKLFVKIGCEHFCTNSIWRTYLITFVYFYNPNYCDVTILFSTRQDHETEWNRADNHDVRWLERR